MFKVKGTHCTSHFQERVYNDGLDPCGAVHITVGDGGNREGLAERYSISSSMAHTLNHISRICDLCVYAISYEAFQSISFVV